MILKEKVQDLFRNGSEYYLAHCISSDYRLGAGIAIDFDRRYNMRVKLKKVGKRIYPDCILIDNVYNLVTKKYCFGKPTYETLRKSLELMKSMTTEGGIKKIAMPLIGCGLDRLKWEKVRAIIEDVFSDTDIEILVCRLKK